MKRSLASTLLLTSSLVIGGCGSPNAGQDSAETVTVQQTVTEYEDPTPAESASPAEEASPETQPERPAPEAAPAPPAGNHNINVGQVGGDCGTTSAGEEINAYDATSCEFAAAIYDAAMQADFASSGSSTPHVYLDVVSPATGGTYSIDCWPGSSGETLICDNPNDRNVGAHFTGPNGGYWHSKLGVV